MPVYRFASGTGGNSVCKHFSHINHLIVYENPSTIQVSPIAFRVKAMGPAGPERVPRQSPTFLPDNKLNMVTPGLFIL